MNIYEKNSKLWLLVYMICILTLGSGCNQEKAEPEKTVSEAMTYRQLVQDYAERKGLSEDRKLRRQTMNTKMMKYIGIAVMLAAHPLGYHLFYWILLGPLAYSPSYEYAETAVFVGVGILEIFFAGLALFVMGIVSGRKKD